MSKEDPSRRVRVTLLKSLAGRLPRQRACVHGLGLHRIHESAELFASPAVMGMIGKVAFMLRVEQL